VRKRSSFGFLLVLVLVLVLVLALAPAALASSTGGLYLRTTKGRLHAGAQLQLLYTVHGTCHLGSEATLEANGETRDEIIGGAIELADCGDFYAMPLPATIDVTAGGRTVLRFSRPFAFTYAYTLLHNSPCVYETPTSRLGAPFASGREALRTTFAVVGALDAPESYPACATTFGLEIELEVLSHNYEGVFAQATR